MIDQRDLNDGNPIPFFIGLLLGIAGTILVCHYAHKDDNKSKTRITPSLEINCDGSKCDTTFIYKQ